MVIAILCTTCRINNIKKRNRNKDKNVHRYKVRGGKVTLLVKFIRGKASKFVYVID
jgi:hypothetical protein